MILNVCPLILLIGSLFRLLILVSYFVLCVLFCSCTFIVFSTCLFSGFAEFKKVYAASLNAHGCGFKRNILAVTITVLVGWVWIFKTDADWEACFAIEILDFIVLFYQFHVLF